MRKRRYGIPALLIIAVLLSNQLSAAMEDSRRNSGELTSKGLGGDFFKDAGQIWSYPFRLKSRDILPLAALAATVAVLIPNDEAIYRGFYNYRAGHAWVRQVSPVITTMGAYGAWGTAGLFLTVGLLAKDSKAVETAALAGNAMLQSQLVVIVIKSLAGRRRPDAAGGLDHWSGPTSFLDSLASGSLRFDNSFPSGHSITVFSLATVVAMQYQDRIWFP
jgi:membrane-associated phospholipid phosphatase